MIHKVLDVKHGVLLLHVAFVLMLTGACITHFFQEKGRISLYQNIPSNVCISDEGFVRVLDCSLRLDSFYISYDNNGCIKDYISILTVMPGNTSKRVSMNNILCEGDYRFCFADYNTDFRKITLLVNRDPVGIFITYLGYLLMGIGFMIVMLRYKRTLIVATLLFIVIAFALSLKQYNQPILITWLLPVHVSLILTSYVLLFLSIISRKYLVVALGFLSYGIFIGAYWASISWGEYWSWDPKETCALLTLLVYSLPVHRKRLTWFNNKTFYTVYMISALITIAITFWGVNNYFGGMHSYSI